MLILYNLVATITQLNFNQRKKKGNTYNNNNNQFVLLFLLLIYKNSNIQLQLFCISSQHHYNL